MPDQVTYASEGGVATVSLDSPATHNALSLELLAELRAAVERAVSAADVDVLLLRGEGRMFSVGGLIDEMSSAPDGGRYMEQIGEVFNPIIEALHGSDLITLAAVRGAVAGGAIGLMSATDVVLAGRGTVFTFAYSKIGASFDGGGSWFSARDLGYRRAIELFLSSRRIDAEEALRIGLVSRLVDDEELDAAARAFATEIAGGSPASARAGKRLLRQATDRSLGEQLDDEIAAFAELARGEDFARLTAAFLARR